MPSIETVLADERAKKEAKEFLLNFLISTSPFQGPYTVEHLTDIVNQKYTLTPGKICFTAEEKKPESGAW